MSPGDGYSVPSILGRQGSGEARLGVEGRRVGAGGHAFRVALQNWPVHATDELLHLGGPKTCLLGKNLCLGD